MIANQSYLEVTPRSPWSEISAKTGNQSEWKWHFKSQIQSLNTSRCTPPPWNKRSAFPKGFKPVLFCRLKKRTRTEEWKEKKRNGCLFPTPALKGVRVWFPGWACGLHSYRHEDQHKKRRQIRGQGRVSQTDTRHFPSWWGRHDA